MFDYTYNINEYYCRKTSSIFVHKNVSNVVITKGNVEGLKVMKIPQPLLIIKVGLCVLQFIKNMCPYNMRI